MFERKEKKNWAVSQIGNSNECLPPDFQSPKLMECLLFHQLFIMLVVLHGGWLATGLVTRATYQCSQCLENLHNAPWVFQLSSCFE